MADVLLDIRQRHHIGFAAKTDRVSGCASARGAADAVHVVFGILRQVVVDDVLHVGNVQAARCDVGTNQHGQRAGLEVHEHAQAFLLRNVARDRLRVNAVRLEIVLHAFGLALHVDEDHDAPFSHLANEPDEQRHLVFVGREENGLAYAVRSNLVGLDAD